MAKVGPERQARKEEVGECGYCLKRLPAGQLDIHEIASGASRERCLFLQELQIVVCRKCHEIVQGLPAAKQIAIRIRWNIEHTCRKYCELKGYAPTAVVADEVIDYLIFKNKGKKKRIANLTTKGK